MFVFLALGSASAAAQTMYKCTDAQGRVTYSNEACDKQGLKDAGTVANRITTMPLGPAPSAAKPAASATAGKAPAARALDDAEVSSSTTQIKPVNPLIEKLLK